MENRVFPSPAVARVLNQHYVESRLHTDGETNIARIRELRDRLAGTIATPTYVLVDPATGEERGRFEGLALSEDQFAEFLEEGTRE